MTVVIVKVHDGKVQMIDSSIGRVHRHASGAKKSGDCWIGRNQGGLTMKIHARVEAKGRPVCLLIFLGEVHDFMCAEALLVGLERRTIVIADKGCNAERVRGHIGLKAPF